jgi:hypothetical protein
MLASNSDLRADYGKRARLKVVTSFSMQKMVSELEHVYNGYNASIRV